VPDFQVVIVYGVCECDAFSYKPKFSPKNAKEYVFIQCTKNIDLAYLLKKRI